MATREIESLLGTLRYLVGRSTRAICDSHLLLTEALSGLTAEQRAYVLGLRGADRQR